jgi:hypothetical protein
MCIRDSNMTALATALNADLAARTGLPYEVQGASFSVTSGINLKLSIPCFNTNFGTYTITTSLGTFTASSNVTSLSTNETWTDMWVEALYTNTEEKYSQAQDADLVKIGTQGCKLTEFKCIGRFKDVPNLEEKINSQLVKILATNQNFFNSIL